MKKKQIPANYATATQLVHGGKLQSPAHETSEALFLNSAYSYDTAEELESLFAGEIDGFKYGRYSHPNLAMLEERLSLMEGAEACAVTASGMAAMFAALMCQLKSGDHVVAGNVLFSSCHYIITEILPRFNISYTLVPAADKAGWEKAITDKTAVVFLESPANPTLDITDISYVAKLAHAKGAKLIVDNVFASPLVQKPLELGADIVMYSTTKHIDGQGRTLGGAILGSKDFIENTCLPFCRHTGPHMSHFNAWILLKSLETLSLRTKQHCTNAQAIAQKLDGHAQLSRLIYPGLQSHPQHDIAKQQMKNGGPMLALELKGGKEAAFKFMNGLKLFEISNNLGNAKSLATHPASTTHASIGAQARADIGIKDGLVRLSPGIEETDDLVADVLSALQGL